MSYSFCHDLLESSASRVVVVPLPLSLSFPRRLSACSSLTTYLIFFSFLHSRTNQPSNVRGAVRNLGKPVALCKQYFDGGADEVVFLNITSFRQGVIEDLPMLKVSDNHTFLLLLTLIYSPLLYLTLLFSV